MRKLGFLLLVSLLVTIVALVACSTTTTTTTTTTTSTAPPASTTTSATTTTAATTATTTTTQTTTRPTTTVPTTAAPVYGGTYITASSVPITTVLRERVTGLGIENVWDRVSHDTLLRLDEKGNLAPFLATAWNIDAQANTITLTLRKGVKFHDGTDFNAQAVKFSWDLRKTEYKNTVFNAVKSVDVVDDYTVRINLTQFDNTFLPALWFIPSLVSSPTNYTTLGKEKAELTLVGTGPFILKEYNQDVGFKFVKNPNYWQSGKPYLDGFEYRLIADPTTQELLFRSGEVDIPPIDADIQQRLKDTGKYLFVPQVTAPPFWELVPDSANPSSPWSKLKVREAAEYAIDKAAIARKLGGPTAVAQYQWGPEGTYAYLPDLPARKYDPQKAKQLLAEAGYPNGFKTTAFVGATIQYVRDMELSVHEYWRQVGIDVEYNQLTLATFLEKSRTGWQNGVMDGAPRIVPDWLAAANSNWSKASAAATMNSRLRTDELDALLLKAKSTPDLAERNRLSQDINKYISDNCLSILIYSGGGIGGTLYQPTIHNVGGSTNNWGASVLWGPADIWKSK